MVSLLDPRFEPLGPRSFSQSFSSQRYKTLAPGNSEENLAKCWVELTMDNHSIHEE